MSMPSEERFARAPTTSPPHLRLVPPVQPTRGRHRMHQEPWWKDPLENGAYVATIVSVLLSLLVGDPPPLVPHNRSIAMRDRHRAARRVVHATEQHADGTPADTPECLDATLAPKNVVDLLDDENVLIARLQVLVSPFCGVAFGRLVHVIKDPWHGAVYFTFRRAGIAHALSLKNLFDPLTTAGWAVPDGGCLDVSASIARTEFEATREATVACVALADVA